MFKNVKNWMVVFFVFVSCLFYVYFNHANSHLKAQDFYTMNKVDSFTVVSYAWSGIWTAISFCCFGIRPRNLDNYNNIVSDPGSSVLVFQWNTSSSIPDPIQYIVDSSMFAMVSGFLIVGVLAYFHMQHSLVKHHSEVNGELDVDEYFSSSTARCCVKFEERTEKLFARLRVPDEEITISPLLKSAVFFLALICPFVLLAAFVLKYASVAGTSELGSSSEMNKLWIIACMDFCSMSQILTVSSCCLLMLVDLKNVVSR